MSMEAILVRITEGILAATNGEVNAKTQVQLADILNIRQSSISDAKRRNSLPADWCVTLLSKYQLNPEWLATGEGEMFLIPSASPSKLIFEKELKRIREIATRDAKYQLVREMDLKALRAVAQSILPEGVKMTISYNDVWEGDPKATGSQYAC